MKRSDFWKYILGLCSFGFLNGKLSAKETIPNKIENIKAKYYVVSRTCKLEDFSRTYNDTFYFENREAAIAKYKKLKVYDEAIRNNDYGLISSTVIYSTRNI